MKTVVLENDTMRLTGALVCEQKIGGVAYLVIKMFISGCELQFSYHPSNTYDGVVFSRYHQEENNCHLCHYSSTCASNFDDDYRIIVVKIVDNINRLEYKVVSGDIKNRILGIIRNQSFVCVGTIN